MFGTLDNPTQNFQTARLEELVRKLLDGKHGGCVQRKKEQRGILSEQEKYMMTRYIMIQHQR